MMLSSDAPVLQVDTNVVAKVDTSPENLFNMWTVFSKCRDSVAQGRRLENFSWRVWNRETFCCDPEEALMPPTITHDIKRTHSNSSSSDNIPQLSGSVDSVLDEEAVELASVSAPVDILRPRIQRQDSIASTRSRGKERHLTSVDLEKLVVSIVEARVPLGAPLPNIIPCSQSVVATRLDTKKTPALPLLERSGSETTESPCKLSETPSVDSLPPASIENSPRHRTIVRGFTPQNAKKDHFIHQMPLSPLIHEIPAPEEGSPPTIVQHRMQVAKFTLGGSSNATDDSISDHGNGTRNAADESYSGMCNGVPKLLLSQPVSQSQPQPQLKKAKFMCGGSTTDDDVSPGNEAMKLLSPQVVQDCPQSRALVSYPPSYDESAIEDEDSDAWEDSIEEELEPSTSVHDTTPKIEFRKVPSIANMLPSRGSALSLQIANMKQQERSQSTTAISLVKSGPIGHIMAANSAARSFNDSDDAQLMMKRGSRVSPMRPINEIPISHSSAQPIVTAANGGHDAFAADSPKTTRRYMLAHELTMSLRKQLVLERRTKNSTAQAVLKRRHTSNDIINLRQHPDQPFLKREVKDVAFDPDFSFQGYHAKGW